MSLLPLLVVAFTSTASAQDCDARWPLACVAADATVSSGVQIGSSVTIDAYASIGPDITIGELSYIATRSVLTGNVDAATPDVLGAGTIPMTLIGPPQ